MLDWFRDFLNDLEGESGDGRRQSGIDPVQRAAAALLIEAARLDDRPYPDMRARIVKLLGQHFRLGAEDAETLTASAEAEAEGAAAWFRFTDVVREHFSDAQRIELIEMLWEVVYASGSLNELEASLLRRVGGLLYVSDRDRGAARLRVLKRLGLPEEAGL